jgi:hypothetical protein
MKINKDYNDKLANVISKIRFKRLDIIVVICALLFSSWLMFHTFSYDSQAHQLHIAYKLWSDFGAHIPLIRSFSMGENLPRLLRGTLPEYPLFPGEPIRYHFLFYLLVGLLEKIGLRIDWALNIPSIVGLSLFLYSLYVLAKRITGSIVSAVLTIVFFLFNGSLGFLRFFTLHPISSQTLTDILHAKDFPAFAPWGPGEVTAFWNLNIYTNQRHLAGAFAVTTLFILTCMKISSHSFKRQIPWAIGWGMIFGILPYFHQPTLLIIAMIMATYILFIPTLRLFLLSTGALTTALVLPQLYLMRGVSTGSILWYPGYIIHNELMKQQLLPMIGHVASFWWQNIGIHSLLIGIGWMCIPAKTRTYLLPIIPLFIIPNLFKFSVEASANHKFFNYCMALGDILSAHAYVSLYQRIGAYVTSRTRARHMWEYIGGMLFGFISMMIIPLTLSGIIDFFVIVNDVQGKLNDIPKNEIALWIDKNTAKDAVFLNSNYLYHPASIVGRAIFLGWPYFAWSAGYQENRMPIMDRLYETRNAAERCTILKARHISYVTVEQIKNDTNLPDIDLGYFLKTYTPSFVTKDKNYAIFQTSSLCPTP